MTITSQLVLGVDGGGTKTVAWLAVGVPALAGASEPPEAGTPTGRGVTGPGNPRAVGFAAAQANIDAAIDAAFTAAALPRTTVAAACLALAGAGREAERETMLAWARKRRIAHNVRVTTDAEPILAAASPENWGIALICGTGSLAWGRSRAGTIARCGGWGYLLGDEGSAYWIALAGLQAAVRAADQRDRPTALLDQFLQRLNTAEPHELVDRIYDPSMTRDRIAAMADVVFALAESDEVAAGIVEAGAASLADMIAVVAQRLEFSSGAFPLALTGSVVLNQESYRNRILSHLASKNLSPATVTPVAEPVRGAVAIARTLLV
jgi:N-acetylmuramic acid 6-phosphate etherase